MIRYEMLILSIPEITQDESQRMESQLSETIRNGSGSVISFEKWGKYRLAYPVNKNDYGIYYLIRFEIKETDTTLLDDIKSYIVVKLNDLIMRYMIINIDSVPTLEYQRPQSLEEAPAREMGAYMKPGFNRGRNRSDRDHSGRRSEPFGSRDAMVETSESEFAELEQEALAAEME